MVKLGIVHQLLNNEAMMNDYTKIYNKMEKTTTLNIARQLLSCFREENSDFLQHGDPDEHIQFQQILFHCIAVKTFFAFLDGDCKLECRDDGLIVEKDIHDLIVHSTLEASICDDKIIPVVFVVCWEARDELVRDNLNEDTVWFYTMEMGKQEIDQSSLLDHYPRTVLQNQIVGSCCIFPELVETIDATFS